MRSFLRFLTVTALCLAPAGAAWSASKVEIDARISAALESLYEMEPAARELANKAAGVLVMPRVYKLGFGLGGEYGEGALLINNQAVQYYRVTAASFGFQLGGQAKSEVLMFMSSEALEGFRNSDGWEAGVDGAVTFIEFGVGKDFNTHTLQDPIIGFVYGNKGLMYDLSLEGSKFWRIDKS
jgi:lipid-binding SYLF domain-containing protein